MSVAINLQWFALPFAVITVVYFLLMSYSLYMTLFKTRELEKTIYFLGFLQQLCYTVGMSIVTLLVFFAFRA